MPNITGAPIIGQSLYTTSTVAQASLGQLNIDNWGNRYRYALVGGVALVTANCLQEPAEDTQFVSMAVPATVAAGVTSITVTNGTTAVTANMFVGGRLTISVTPGIGQSFYITGNTAGASGAAITYNIDRPLVTGLTTSSKVSVRKNPYAGVIQTPVTTQTGAAVGFATFAPAASTYAFIQSGGDAAVLFDTGANTANDQLGIAPSVAVAGAVKAAPAAAGMEVIGYSHQVASVDSTTSLAHIIID